MMEYCRNWRAASSSTTPTDVYCPGNGELSSPESSKAETVSLSFSIPVTVTSRKTSPGATPSEE